MKIVVIDGSGLNPGDLSWSALAELGSLTVHDRTPEAQIVERARGAEVIFVNKARLTRGTIEQLPGLRYIGVLATGHDMVDVAAARDAGITVTNVPAYGTASVAQFVFALILELCSHVAIHDRAAKSGEWSRAPDFSYWKVPLIELAGKTIGIVGFGRIGREVANIALAMRMLVLASSSGASAATGRDVSAAQIEWAETAEIFRRADFLSLHCPLTPETRGMVNRTTLNQMKRGAFLINTARGALVVEQDLADALNEGRIAGAAVDVLSVEPPPPSNPLLSARNCIVTPHIAWTSLEARGRLLRTAADNLRAFLAGRPVHVVS